MPLVKIFFLSFVSIACFALDTQKKQLAYLASDTSIPYWEIMSKGINAQAKQLGYEVSLYNANNILKNELKNTVEALRSKVDALIISPVSSSSAVTVLKLAQRAQIPVVISDIGADSDEYISYIAADNRQGAYALGQILAKKMHQLKWQDGSVGIIAIPQKRANGKARTAGFLEAMQEAEIQTSGLYQQVDFSYKETYNYAKKLIAEDPKLRALWLQGSDKYKGALDAISDADKEGEILLVCFDAEPEFLEMIPRGELVGAAMQQPFLMGEKAVELVDAHLHNKKVQKKVLIPILPISQENIQSSLPLIKRNVLGLQSN